MDLVQTHREFIETKWGTIKSHLDTSVLSRVREAPNTSAKKLRTNMDDMKICAEVANVTVALNSLSRSLLLRGKIQEAIGDKEMYSRLKHYVMDFLHGWKERLGTAAPADIMARLTELWYEYAALRDAVAFLFRYLDQHFTQRYATAGYVPLRTMCNNCLKEILYTPLQGIIHSGVVAAVMGCRGKSVEEILSFKPTLYASIQLIHTMNDYEATLEKTYVQAIEQTCKANTQAWKSEPMENYLLKVDSFIKTETRVLDECFGIPKTTQKVLTSIRKIHLCDQRDTVLTHPTCGVIHCLKDTAALSLLYTLYSFDATSVGVIASEFGKAGEERLKKIPTDSPNAIIEIHNVLQQLQDTVRSCCGNNERIQSAISTKFNEIIPTLWNKFDVMLNSSIETAVRKPEQNVPVTVSSLMSFVTNRPMFTQLLIFSIAQRHFNRVVTQGIVERDLVMLNSARGILGGDHSRVLKVISNEAVKTRPTVIHKQGGHADPTSTTTLSAGGGPTVTVRRINAVAWSVLQSTETKYTPCAELTKAYQGIESQAKKDGKVTKLSLSYGMSEIQMDHPKFHHGVTITCNHLQLSLLLALQRKTKTIANLVSELGIQERELRSILRTVVDCGLVVVGSEDSVSVNKDWAVDKAKIVLPQPSASK
eukprot:PhF_6_TR37881/c0_g1_i1/m.56515